MRLCCGSFWKCIPGFPVFDVNILVWNMFCHLNTGCLQVISSLLITEASLSHSLVSNWKVGFDSLYIQGFSDPGPQKHQYCNFFIETWIYWLMDVQMFWVANVLMNMSHQEESVMRGLSTETTLTTVQTVQSARRCAEKKKDELLFTWNSSPQVLTCELGVDSCHFLNLGNFLWDHQLLHSWDFHTVLCRLDWEIFLTDKTGHMQGSAQTRRCVRLVFSSTVKIRLSIWFGNYWSLSAVPHVILYPNCWAHTELRR